MLDRAVDQRCAAGPDAGPGVGVVAELDEPTLVARAQDGDLAAFEALVDRYQGPLFRLARRMLTNHTDAEDVVQDSLIAIWRRLPPRQRACWLLREVHGRSYPEIAAILAITDTAVRGQLARARAGLARGMSSWR